MSAHHQETSVSFRQRMLQCSITNMSSVEKKILHAIVAATHRWVTHMPTDPNLSIVALNWDQRFGNFAAKKCVNAISPIRARWQVMDYLSIVTEHEMN